MKTKPTLVLFQYVLMFIGLTSLNAQCPTVSNNIQSFCDVESFLVSDLEATDTGGGVFWYDTATSTVPLSNSDGLVNGEDYYADDNTGTCGTRARVDVVIYGPPAGQNFQGICLDDPTLATVADLIAVGNDVQWYLTQVGGVALSDSTILIDDTIYYADQSNPDSGCRSSRLSVLVNVGLTPIPSGDMIQEFCVTPQFTPTVSDLVASGLNNWYISQFSALPLLPSTPLVDGQTYYATTLDPPCESIGRLAVEVVLTNNPNPGTDETLNLCENSTTPIDLFTILGGSPELGGTWSPTLNSGTGIYDPTIDPLGVYTYTIISSNTCSDQSATVTITTTPEPNAGTDGTLEICSNNDPVDLFGILGGSPETGGIWSPALNSGTGIFNPSIDASGIYTYTVSGNPPCDDATATINVTVTAFNDAGENGAVEICSNDGTIDLFDSLGGTPDSGGTWSPTLNSGTGIFDPNTDLEGIYTYSFSGNVPCTDSFATVNVTVNELLDAGSNTILELCSTDTSIVDLFNSLGGTPDTGGTWSPVLNSGTSIFDPTVDNPGIYTYTIAGTSPCPDTSATVNIIIIPEPNAGLDVTIDICDNDGTINLLDSLGGSPNSGGIWSPTLNSGTNIFDPTLDAEGIYTYTVTGTAPCIDASATVTISVTPYIDAGLDGSIELCSDDSTVNLFDSLEGTPDTGGTWSPALTSGTGIFDPSIDSAGTYTYSTTSTGPCLNDSAVVVVSVIIVPDAGIDNILELCSTSTVDLFDSLGGTPDTGGTWSPTLNSGTGVFDPNTDPEGIYTYTLTSVCGDSSASVTVSVAEPNDAGSNGAIDLCTTDSAVDLFDSLGGTPDTGGIWSPALNSGSSIFDPSIDSPGTYTYTIESNLTSCPDASASVTVSIFEIPNAGTDGTLNLCNATNVVDLFDSLGGTPETGGTWSPAMNSGTGIFDPNIDPEGVYTYTLSNLCGTSSATVSVSFTNLNDAGSNGSLEICNNDTSIDLFDSLGGTPQPGGTWSPILNSGTGIFDPSIDPGGSYTYTISNSSSLCPDASATVTVSLLLELDAGSDGALSICDINNSIDLFDSLVGTPDIGGTWSPALNSGTGIFDPSIDPEGIYTYTISNVCGTNSATVSVSFSNLNDAGSDGSLDLCSNDSSVDLFDSLEGTPQLGGAWSPALSSGTGVFDPTIDPSGVYTYTVLNAGSICPEDSATVNVTILQEPNAGNDGTLSICDINNSIDLFDSLVGTPDIGGTWSPALNSGTGIFDPSIDPEGIYTYTISNVCGTNSATVSVSFSNLNDAGSDGSLDLCSNDSSVDLFDSLEGTPQLGGAWSPALSSGTGVFDPTIDPSGVYTYTVLNAGSICPEDSATVNVTILPLPNAGNDSTLILCTDDVGLVDLFDSLDGSPDTGGTWSPALNSGTGIFDPSIDVAGIYTYTVNSTQCNLTDDAALTVTIENVPNAAGLTMTVDDIICFDTDVVVNIAGANQLADGDYTINYELSGANILLNSTTISISGGNSVFTIPLTLLPNTGLTILTLSELFFIDGSCTADTSLIDSIEIFILDVSTPQLTGDGSFCEFDNPTIADLNASIIDSEDIIWYDQPNNGIAYSDTDLLLNGVTYYAALLAESGCESTIRLEVTVTLDDCALELIIPDGFSPNGDTINDDFHIINLNELYPNFKLSFYNRYGNILYEGDISSQRWDGTSRNSNTVLPVGVYFYILEFNDGSRDPIQGRVYLSQ